jgi:hypothetical protein
MDLFGLNPGFVVSRRSWHPQRGTTTYKRALGTQAEIQAIESACIAAGVECDADYRSVPCSIEVAFEGADDNSTPNTELSSIWELDNVKERLTAWEQSAIVALLGSMTTAGVAQFKSDVSAVLAIIRGGEYTARAAEAVGYVDAAITAFPSAAELIKRLALESHDTFQRNRYVLRHTATFRRGATLSFAFTDVDKQITSANLITATNTAGTPIPFSIPASKYWTFQGPTMRQQTDGRLVLVREWIEEDQDTFYYGVIS